MSLSDSKSSSDGITGVCPAPPPPPPPPVPGQVPALRISTTEHSAPRPRPPSNDTYEPPAAIQNAMLTKDKKPFTYTPGMGGKLDLSQIRSPRMARRVAKNANDEGIEGPPKSALESPKTPPTQAGANIYIQPQVAVPVFPASMPTQPLPNKTVVNNVNRAPVTPVEKQVEPPKNVFRVEPKPVSTVTYQPSSPETPTSPTQVTLTKAPTPWMKRTKSQEEDLPEWARRPTKSQESSPETMSSPPVYVVQQSSPPPPPQRNQVPQNFANQRPQQQQQARPSSREHVVPLRVEDRPSVFSVENKGGHHQFKQSNPQQRWGPQSPQPMQVPVQMQDQTRPPSQMQFQNEPQSIRQNQMPQKPQNHQQSGGTYIVPMKIDGKEPPKQPGALIVQSSIPSQTRIIPIQPPSPVVNPQRNPMQQAEGGPIQSKSFRVLQKITSTDTPDEVDGDQLRKLQLTEDDKMLMNKFKEHVDNDNYLHQEEDPRYRGAAIPSRAFRYLQNMTDAGEITSNTLPRANNPINKKQNRNSRTFDEVQVNLPPSEQQVAEPKKYSGSAIPSRSFRILQAMTEPQSVAAQEYHQADFVCQSDSSITGNQQGIFFPPFVPSFWSQQRHSWGFYPLPPYAFPPPHYYNYSSPYPFYPGYPTPYYAPQATQTLPSPQPPPPPSESSKCNFSRRNSTMLFSPKTTDITTLPNDTQISTRLNLDDSDSDVELSKSSSSSSASDSDSYLAYSTGLNPMDNGTTSASATTISEDTYDKCTLSRKHHSLDYGSEIEDEAGQMKDTTVSVCLPLRLKFSVSENNEEVTTVIVGDSTVKPDLERNNKVDFTLRRMSSPECESNLHAEFTIRVRKNPKDLERDDGRCSSSKNSSFVGNVFETDDEDSGVTSDVSRIVSEIDTDSECCPVKRQNAFQRTQTHSRLFKLLTEDSSEERIRNRLSLPADFGSEDYEDRGWSRLHEVDGSTREENDAYYQKWKVARSEDSQKLRWTYRVNVQCPRVRTGESNIDDYNKTGSSIPS